MRSKTKFAILGIGGVGGYYGGKLAARYSGSDAFEINFIARGENGKAILSKGLHLVTPSGEQIIHPDHVLVNAEETGPIDILLCCVKAYDLAEGLQSIRTSIHQDTVILPLLNGVDHTERIQKIFPQAKVWNGCVYIVSRLIAPGTVNETGNSNLLILGSETESEETIKKMESVFTNAGINAKGTREIRASVWTKFIFLSPIATLTTSLNLPIGAVLENESSKELLHQLVTEISAIAKKRGIGLSSDIVPETMDKIEKLPYTTYSSMHYDFNRGKKTEIDSLTGYVVKLGKELSVATPVHDKLLSDLLKQIKPHHP